MRSITNAKSAAFSRKIIWTNCTSCTLCEARFMSNAPRAGSDSMSDAIRRPCDCSVIAQEKVKSYSAFASPVQISFD